MTLPPDTLLVRLPNPLGDVVMATPLLRALKTAWPKTKIVVAGKPQYRTLLAGLDSFDEFIDLASSKPHHHCLREICADMALILPNSWSSAIAVWRSGIPQRIGRRKQGRQILLQNNLSPILQAAPMTEIYADFLPLLGLARKIPAAELVAKAPPNTPLPVKQKILAVAPGAAFGPSKIYPAEKLCAALLALHHDHGFHLVLLGAPEERAKLAQLAQQLDCPVTLTAPEHNGLDEAKAILYAATVVLSTDNGARHMAAALGTPQVVLYGPTHPQWSAHALEKTTILRREELDCLNCHHKICPLPEHPCMTRIEPETLQWAVQQAVNLKEPKTSSP